MANFRQHLGAATLFSGLLASVCVGAELTSPSEAIGLWAAGSLGGILPDIDSDNSLALNIIFSFFVGLCIFFIFSYGHARYSILVLWGVCIAVYSFVTFVIRPLFEAVTVHRGVFHSVLAGLFFSFFGVNMVFHLGGAGVFHSWLVGLFVLLGFLIHLLLDELYSVDFCNIRIKRSFGTALKLFDYKNGVSSLVMIALTVASYYSAPRPVTLYSAIVNENVLRQIKDNFFP